MSTETWQSDRGSPNRAWMERAIQEVASDPIPERDDLSGSRPFVSVIVPSYNSGKFLERTVRSVASQVGRAVELIVVDGVSTDCTQEVLGRIRHLIDLLIIEPDQGQADAINKGFRRSRGEWLCFLGADDLLLPGAIHALEACAQRNPHAELIFGDFLHVNAEDAVVDVQIVLPRPSRLLHFSAMQCHNQATFVRRSLLDRVGLLDSSLVFCMDYEFLGRCIGRAVGPCKIDRFIGAQRIHSDTKTSTLRDVHDREKRMIQMRWYGFVLATVLQVVLPLALKIRRAGYFISRGQWWYLLRQVRRTW